LDRSDRSVEVTSDNESPFFSIFDWIDRDASETLLNIDILLRHFAVMTFFRTDRSSTSRMAVLPTASALSIVSGIFNRDLCWQC
jgi:hypothetical protein